MVEAIGKVVVLCHCLTALLLPAAMVISLGRVATMTKRLVMHLIEVMTSKVKEIEVLDEARLLVEVVGG